MKTLAILVIGLLGLSAEEALSQQNTNKTATAINVLRKQPNIRTNEFTVKPLGLELPLVKKEEGFLAYRMWKNMDYKSDGECFGASFARDYFLWGIPIGKNTVVGWWVDCKYPISQTGPYFDGYGTGIAVSWSLGSK